MSKIMSSINDPLKGFIEKQHLFFVGTAAKDGRVNVSPKGMDSLRVMGKNRVVWLNLTGSGNETAAQVLDTNRMTLMFCSFEEMPLILRLYGKAEIIHPRDPAWNDLISLFPPHKGARQIFDVAIETVQTSCGYAVPFFDYTGERSGLTEWADKKEKRAFRPIGKRKTKRVLTGWRLAFLNKTAGKTDHVTTARHGKQPLNYLDKEQLCYFCLQQSPTCNSNAFTILMACRKNIPTT